MQTNSWVSMQTNTGGLSPKVNVTIRSIRDWGEVPCCSSRRANMAGKLTSADFRALFLSPQSRCLYVK